MSLPSAPVTFGEWLPDLGRVNNPGATVATNVVPTATGYKPMPSLSPIGNAALPARALAAHWLRANQSHVFAGTGAGLYRRQIDRTWADVSRVDAQGDLVPYATVDRWAFTSFGHNMVAVSPFNTPQVFNADVSEADLRTARFTDISAAPWAYTAGSVQDFLVLGNLDPDWTVKGDVVGGENTIAWSGYNNLTQWGSEDTQQADYQPLSGDGGAVQRIVSGTVGHIFRQNSIVRMEYAGSDIVFALDEFALGRGTSAPDSVVRVGTRIYYYDNAGFYALDINSREFEPIGHNRVDATVASMAPQGCRDAMRVAVDPQHKQIVWAFCTDSSATFYNRLVAYSYELDRWSIVHADVDLIASLPSTALSLDDLDTALPGGIDANSILVESQQFLGGAFALSGFDTEHRLGTFSGPALTATLSGSEIGTPSDRQTMTNRQRALLDSGGFDTAVSVSLEHRDNLTATPETTGYLPANEFGFAEAVAKATFLKFYLRLTGGFRHCSGLEVFSRVAQ